MRKQLLNVLNKLSKNGITTEEQLLRLGVSDVALMNLNTAEITELADLMNAAKSKRLFAYIISDTPPKEE